MFIPNSIHEMSKSDFDTILEFLINNGANMKDSMLNIYRNYIFKFVTSLQLIITVLKLCKYYLIIP